jgi:hypothetical protein
MNARLIEATYLCDHRIFVRFEDGVAAPVDFTSRLHGKRGLAAELLAPECFENFHIDPEWNTLVWANGWDIAPDVLYDLAMEHVRSLADARA